MSFRRAALTALCLLSLIAALALPAMGIGAVKTTWWHSPSGNIACSYHTITTPSQGSVDCQTQNNLRVVILEHDGRATSGNGIAVGSPGRVLAYAHTIRKGGFVCRSQRNGMRCYSTVSGHGFRIYDSGWQRIRVPVDN